MFREKIKMAIGAKNLRVCQVATECGIVSTSLSSYLNGSRGLKYDQQEKLVAYLGLHLTPRRLFISIQISSNSRRRSVKLRLLHGKTNERHRSVKPKCK